MILTTEPGTDHKLLVYRGRFAPTPSGPLHFGSLVAAMGSFLDARHQEGEWLVRMEDLDPPREVAGAAAAILHALEAYGFEWDGTILYQHQRTEAYRDALEELACLGLIYGCGCSRKQLSTTTRRGLDGPVYPGTCRRQPLSEYLAARLRVPMGPVSFVDALQGQVSCNLADECGDFVLRRADGVYTYQLAVVVDDAAQGITHIVRGADLLTSTPRQIALQRYLNLPSPAYTHLPIALDREGFKLSKQTMAAPIDPRHPLGGLIAAARFLGMPPPADLGTPAEFWSWALLAWPHRLLPPIRGQRLPASLCNS